MGHCAIRRTPLGHHIPLHIDIGISMANLTEDFQTASKNEAIDLKSKI
jgi:hypothetical protein